MEHSFHCWFAFLHNLDDCSPVNYRSSNELPNSFAVKEHWKEKKWNNLLPDTISYSVKDPEEDIHRIKSSKFKKALLKISTWLLLNQSPKEINTLLMDTVFFSSPSLNMYFSISIWCVSEWLVAWCVPCKHSTARGTLVLFPPRTVYAYWVINVSTYDKLHRAAWNWKLLDSFFSEFPHSHLLAVFPTLTQ